MIYFEYLISFTLPPYNSHTNNLSFLSTQAIWILQATDINVTEKLSICVKDVDTMVIIIGCHYTTLTVCCDTMGIKWFSHGR